MFIKDFRTEPTRLASLLFWDAMVTPSVLQLKDGSFMAVIGFRGRDLDASLDVELVAQAERLNNFFRRFGAGWGLMAEVRRRLSTAYPSSHYPDPVTAAIDRERERSFTTPGVLYTNDTYLTLTYRPPQHAAKSWRHLVYTHLPSGNTDSHELEAFMSECERSVALLKEATTHAALLEGDDLLTYLHSTVSTKLHTVRVPSPPCYLDTYLSDQDVTSGLYPRLGGAYLGLISPRLYPQATYPGIYDLLTRLPFEMRVCVRYLPLDRAKAVAVIGGYVKRWYGKRKDMLTATSERMSKRESSVVDQGALENFQSATEAQARASHGELSFGYVTVTVVVWDDDHEQLSLKVKAVETALNNEMFVAKVEDLNAMDAWVGTIPGNVYANARRPLLHSLNVAHLFPATAPWRGQPTNDHLKGPAVLQAVGKGLQPVSVSLHEYDVGHTGVIGTTGDGKSTFLNVLCAQWRRYPGAEVAIFDKGGAAKKLTISAGGQWYDLGRTPLQPLAALGRPYEIAWAIDWLDALLTQEHVTVTPDMKEDLFHGLTELATWSVHKRTMSMLVGLLTHPVAKQALGMYTALGPYGQVLDADEDGIGDCPWLCFEMATILETPRVLGAILPALFHRLEQRLTGVPVLYVLHEGWIAFDTPFWSSRLRGWLKGFRVKNGSVVLATQSLADAVDSPIMPALLDNVATWIFTPNDKAMTKQIGQYYEACGLNERQKEILKGGTIKKHYYVVQGTNAALVDLALGPLTLALCGTPGPQELAEIDQMLEVSTQNFAGNYLASKGLTL